jgi:hypothetical protein
MRFGYHERDFELTANLADSAPLSAPSEVLRFLSPQFRVAAIGSVK